MSVWRVYGRQQTSPGRLPMSLQELLGIDLNTVYWMILGFGFVVLFFAFIFDGLLGFGDDGSMVPAAGVFMGLFGSSGIVGLNLLDLTEVASIFLGGVISTGGAVFFYFGLWKWLKQQENTLEDRREDLIGKLAEVTLTINGDSLGQITYSTDSGRTSAPARSANGASIRQGETVKVLRTAGTTFIVESVNDGEKGGNDAP
ncbi:MAG: NfeD family protein [Candidatus Sumerlaeia bacterium]|nr:NfeD family protein [Candidatus Sumerlaeia bacterium]